MQIGHPEDWPEAVRRRIRALLAEREMTGVQLAQATGWSQTYTSRRLAPGGGTVIDLADLVTIARALDVPVTQLLPEGVARRKRVAA